MDVPSIPHDAFAVCYMEVTGYLVHTHISVDPTSLSLDGIDEGVHVITNALLRVTQYVRVTPTLRIIRVLQLIAGIAAPGCNISSRLRV